MDFNIKSSSIMEQCKSNESIFASSIEDSRTKPVDDPSIMEDLGFYNNSESSNEDKIEKVSSMDSSNINCVNSKPSTDRESTLIEINCYGNEGNSKKELVVLNPVDINSFSEKSVEIGENNIQVDLPESRNIIKQYGNNINRKNLKTKYTLKNKPTLDVKKLKKPLKKLLKIEEETNKTSVTYEKKIINIVQHSEKMYKKITYVETKPQEEPNELSVFDFYDEEDEKLKLEKLEKKKKEQEIKDKTCKICHQLFNDPIDVLRHKREVHKSEKILLPKKELEQYFNMENRKDCPNTPLFVKYAA
ncbi:hypothetical protein ABEB36_007573 [Hypothenemus hampei]|uniref:C2H2-type domain-containing protein n=1 Tax=Hypothenemus hampei TaxID=57062 RepID=A0ABD1EUG6_HYPHA